MKRRLPKKHTPEYWRAKRQRELAKCARMQKQEDALMAKVIAENRPASWGDILIPIAVLASPLLFFIPAC